MKYFDILKYCLALEGVSRSAAAGENTIMLSVDGTAFAFFETDAPVHWRFSLMVTAENYTKLNAPPRILQARNKPGGYWLTIVIVESFDEELLKELINWSYMQALQKAPCE